MQTSRAPKLKPEKKLLEPKVQPSLREQLKQETRTRIENAALQLLLQKGYRLTSIDNIVKLAGTTRTTFYDHFRSKSDLIHVVQERHIAPALINLCKKLDQQIPLSRTALREWFNDYAKTWKRIHVFFEAYNDASRTDAEVAASILPNSYEVAGHMPRLLECVGEAERQATLDKVVMMLTNLDNLMYLVSVLKDTAASNRLLDASADLHWQGLFAAVSPR